MPAIWQEGDTAPPIRFQISEGGAAFDLTPATVKMRFARKGEEPPLWDRECEIDEPPTDGKCHLDWEETDLATSGEFQGQLKLTLTGGTIRLSAVFDILVARSIPEVPAP